MLQFISLQFSFHAFSIPYAARYVEFIITEMISHNNLVHCAFYNSIFVIEFQDFT